MHWSFLIHIAIVFVNANASTPSSKDTNGTTTSFVFPDVKPDPFPVLLQGPAGELINFTNVGYTTNNSFALAYVIVPPNAGPPPHIHHWTNEWFYFPEGGIVMFTSYEPYANDSQIPNGIQLPKANMHRYSTKPGDLIYSPAFYVHGFRNEDNVTRPVINIWTPDKVSRYFFEVGQIVTAPWKLPPIADINKSLFVSQAPKYGINMSAAWDEYVASWSDDWQPLLGMNAHGQELLGLLRSATTENETSQAPKQYVALFQRSCIFIYSISLIIISTVSVLF